MTASEADGVLITGVYSSGKSSVAAEIAYLLAQCAEPYALLDLDYLGWADAGSPGRASEVRLMPANLAAVAANYRQAGTQPFVLAWFVRDAAELQGVRDAAGLPLRVAQLAVPLADIEQRLARDVTTGRRDHLRAVGARSRSVRAPAWLTSWSGKTVPSASWPPTCDGCRADGQLGGQQVLDRK
jgi:hypothetical protein